MKSKQRKYLFLYLIPIIILAYIGGGILEHYSIGYLLENSPFGLINTKISLIVFLVLFILLVSALVKQVLSGRFADINFFIGRHRNKLLAIFLILISGTSATVGFNNNQPTIFNVLNFGGNGNGIRVFDGAISSGSANFSSATANFSTARDLGKCMLIPGAGVAGIDLPVVINSVTNSTTVVVSVAASTSVTADTVNFGTDNSLAFNKAIAADSLNSGGKVFAPNGVYLFNGAFNADCNCIVRIPTVKTGGAVNRTNYVFEGETPPDWAAFADRNGDSLASHAGVTLLPIATGSGNMPSLFGTILTGVNWNYATFRNMKILLPRNLLGGGPTMGGINNYNLLSEEWYNILIAQDGSMKNTPQPSNDVAAFIATKTGQDLMERAQQCAVIGFKYGFVFSDHFVGDNLSVEASVWPYVASNAAYPGTLYDCSIHWCQHGFYVPVTTILGLISPGSGFINVGMVNIESLTIPGSSWATMVDLVNDSSNNGVGQINYYFLSSHATDFKKRGGVNILCSQLGSWGNRIDVSGVGQGQDVSFPIGDGLSRSTNLILQGVLGAGSFGSISFKGSGKEQFRLYSDNGAAFYGTSNTFNGRELTIYDSANAIYALALNGNKQIYLGATSFLQYGLRAETPGAGVRTMTLNSTGNVLIGDSINGALSANVEIYASGNSDLTGLTMQNTNASSSADIAIHMFNDLGQGAGKGNILYKFSSGHSGGLANGFGIYNSDNGPITFGGAALENARMFQTGRTSFGSTVDNAAFIQAGANTTTVAQLFLNGSATDVSSPTNGMLWYNSTTHILNFEENSIQYGIAKTLTGTGVLDFPSTGAGAIADLTITVTGAVVGDAVSIGVPNTALTTTATFWGWVSSSNTVTVRYSPKATEDPASGTFRATIIK